MKISRNWLQNYFEKPLPDTEAINDALTFHAFEIEECESDMMDVKVLPNRAADCLCHRGIAKELSAILNIPLKNDPLREPIPKFHKTDALSVEIEDPKKCLRYIGTVVRGVKIKSSPVWLKEALESVGQRSINNIIDATNYVMLNIGQPLHVFDAEKLTKKDEAYAISVQGSRDGEAFTAVGGEDGYLLPEKTLVITDANKNFTPLAIAGIKGGVVAAIEDREYTTDIIVESANFDGTTIRRTAQVLKLITEASLRFQNRPSPELAAYGMRDVLALISEIAGGEVAGVVDEYPVRSEQKREVSASLQKINGLLGSDFSKEEAEKVFKRLGLDTKIDSGTFIIAPPFERTDLVIPEDLIEEVGRIIGYDRVPATELPSTSGAPDQARYKGIEKVKDFLIEKGFTEVSTQSFAKKGDVYLANPLDKAKPALRTSLEQNLQEALAQAKHYTPLVLAPNQTSKLFEIGTVFTKDGEKLEIATSESVPNLPEMKDDQKYIPQRYTPGTYQPFSIYPIITRDIALWAGGGAEGAERSEVSIEKIIREHASELLIRIDQFDHFEKEGKISLAFRLVFQSFDRTLTDDEVNTIMQKITTALAAKGYEVR